MATYVPNTKSEQISMLNSMGLNSYEELIRDIPSEVRLKSPLNISKGKSLQEVTTIINKIADKNKEYLTSYLGVGAYSHYIPSIVKQVSKKEEFVTAYTPYQAELSQGILQSIFEYQTLICQLTGMDVSNASVYDGATAAAEAVIMCIEKKKNKFLISETMHPHIIETVETICRGRNIDLIKLKQVGGAVSAEDLLSKLDEEVAGVMIQHPNYYGILEDADKIARVVKEAGSKYIIHTNPTSLGVIKSQREYGADIAIGEGQPLGLPLSYGGPYLGYMATKKELTRKLPGRIVGKTVDTKGNTAYVLTLQAREQHIRREKSSSNICSNQALCALTASVYLNTIGTRGLEELGQICMSKAHYLAKALCSTNQFTMSYTRDFFHEFSVDYKGNPHVLLQVLKQHNILGGYVVDNQENQMIWCVTELVSKEEMDRLIRLIQEVGICN